MCPSVGLIQLSDPPFQCDFNPVCNFKCKDCSLSSLPSTDSGKDFIDVACEHLRTRHWSSDNALSSDNAWDSIFKSRHCFANKGLSSQGYGFSSSLVWMWELDYKESWAPKNWCFWTGSKRLLRVPWTVRRSNQSILKEISPECSLEGLMLKLKLQYFGHLMRRADALEKSLMLEKIEGRRRRGQQGII